MAEKNTISILELQQKANDGDAQAQFELALCYAKGTNIEKNAELAFEWHKKAAERGYVNAQFALGLYYLLGKDQKITGEITNKWVHMMTIVNKWIRDECRVISIADYYAFELAVIQATEIICRGANDDFAFAWLKKTAEQNHAESNYWLGICYRDGIGTERNSKLAFECFRMAAEQGIAESQYSLACCYLQGKGVKKSDELGMQWCEKAAEHSIASAQYFLAQCYFDGDYVEQSDELALCWLEKAAENGQLEAQIRLADCYVKGICVEKNDEQAHLWCTKAAENGHAESQYWLARYYFRGGILEQLGEIDAHILENGPYEYWRNIYLDKGYERAFEWAKKAAEGGYTDACLLLGFMNLYGIGTDQNTDSAFDLFKNAAVRDQRGVAAYFIQDLYSTKKITSSGNVKLNTEQANPLAVLQFFDIEELMKNLDEKRQNNLLRLKNDIHLKSRNFDAARILAQKNSEILDVKYVDMAEQLSKTNDELREKNEQICEQHRLLQEKDKELEDMMSMFAHKFRSPLDAIIYNTTHENQVKLYTEAAQTMRGLLNIFSIISTDAEILKDKIKQDCLGNGRLTTVFSKTLDVILLHLLSVSGAEKIQQHYMAYAKAHGQCETEISYKTWCEDYFEIEQSLQSEWEQSFALLLNQSATLEQRLAWLEQHFFKLELIGFERADIQFKEYGVTESFLTILINEILVNAFKYYSSASKQPVVLEWTEREGYQVLICRNPSIRTERTIIKGSHKGQAFLSTLARKTGSAFTKPTPQDDFVVEFGIPDELLISK